MSFDGEIQKREQQERNANAAGDISERCSRNGSVLFNHIVSTGVSNSAFSIAGLQCSIIGGGEASMRLLRRRYRGQWLSRRSLHRRSFKASMFFAAEPFPTPKDGNAIFRYWFGGH